MDKALDAYKNYSEISDSIDMVIFSQDTKFIKDKYEKDLQVAKTRSSRAIITLIAAMTVLVLSFLIFQLRQIIKNGNLKR